jgi:hypothetical protein
LSGATFAPIFTDLEPAKSPQRHRILAWYRSCFFAASNESQRPQFSSGKVQKGKSAQFPGLALPSARSSQTQNAIPGPPGTNLRSAAKAGVPNLGEFNQRPQICEFSE